MNSEDRVCLLYHRLVSHWLVSHWLIYIGEIPGVSGIAEALNQTHHPTQAPSDDVVSAWARESPHAHEEVTRSQSANNVYLPKQTTHVC